MDCPFQREVVARSTARLLTPQSAASALSILFFVLLPHQDAAATTRVDPLIAVDARPQPAEEDLPPGKRGAAPTEPQQTFRDPEREFAVKMLERTQKDLQLLDAHKAVAADAQMSEILNSATQSRREEIARLRAWLANRKTTLVPRMMHR